MPPINVRKEKRQSRQLLAEVGFLMCFAAKIVFQNLRDQAAYKNARSLSVYLSMPSGEISTDAIVRDALESGKEVFVPYFYKATEPAEGSPKSIMDMVQLSSLHDYENLEPDKWGIPTPGKESIASRNNSFGGVGKSESDSQASGLSTNNALDLILLPGMAFDRKLGRLGHGKGFYDYFLHRTLEIYASKGIGMPRLGKVHPSKDNIKFCAPYPNSYQVGLSLAEQVLPTGEEVPTDETDWEADSVLVGDGSVISLP